MKIPLKLLPILALMVAATITHAQNAVDALDSSQFRRSIEAGMKYSEGDAPPELFPGESTDVGPQSILKLKPRRKHWEFSTDSQFMFTSNALLTESPVARTETTLLVNSIQFALAPDPYLVCDRAFAPRIGFRHQWFNYGLEDSGNPVSNFDFDAQTAFIDGRYAIAENWLVYAGIDYVRLLGHQPGVEDYNEFYKELAPRWGVERFFPLGERKLIRLAYQGQYHITSVDPVPPLLPSARNDRINQSLLASYTHVFNAHCIAQPFYRFQHLGYTNTGADRNDFIQSIGASVAWNFNAHVSLRVFSTYDIKESDNAAIPDYRKFDVGGGLSLNCRF